MREYIKKAQLKSEAERKQILVVSVVVCMTIVVFIWVATLGSHFKKEEIVVSENTQQEKNGSKPFSLFGKTIKDTYKNVTASVGNISSTIDKEKEEVEEKTSSEKVIDLIPVENIN